MSYWWIFVIAGLLTFLIRLSFIWLLSHTTLPPLIERILKVVPAAVLSAFIFPELLMQQGKLSISPLNFRLLAGIIAIVIASKTKKPLLTIFSGMTLLLLLNSTLEWLK